MKTVMKLLQQKKELFLKYEEISDELTYQDIERMEVIVDARDELIQQINSIDEEIKNSSLTDKYGTAVYQAIRNRCNRSDVAVELIPLFDLGQEILAVINRLMQMEPRIVQNIDEKQKELEQKIKDSNSLPKIQKYFDTIQTDLEDGSLIRSTAKKI